MSPETRKFLVWRAHKHLTEMHCRPPTYAELAEFLPAVHYMSVVTWAKRLKLPMRKAQANAGYTVSSRDKRGDIYSIIPVDTFMRDTAR